MIGRRLVYGATLASRTVTIRSGNSATVRIRATAAMRRSLRRGRSVSVRVSVSGAGVKAVRGKSVRVLRRT